MEFGVAVRGMGDAAVSIFRQCSLKPTYSVFSTYWKVISTEQDAVVVLYDWLLSFFTLRFPATGRPYNVRRRCIRLSPTFTTPTRLGAETEAEIIRWFESSKHLHVPAWRAWPGSGSDGTGIAR